MKSYADTPGFDAIDVDVRPDGNGWDALRRLRAEGLIAGWVRAVRTPSGGLHLHYLGTQQRNGSFRGAHLDFRGLGGYVLLPPSKITSPSYSGIYQLVASAPAPGDRSTGPRRFACSHPSRRQPPHGETRHPAWTR